MYADANDSSAVGTLDRSACPQRTTKPRQVLISWAGNGWAGAKGSSSGPAFMGHVGHAGGEGRRWVISGNRERSGERERTHALTLPTLACWTHNTLTPASISAVAYQRQGRSTAVQSRAQMNDQPTPIPTARPGASIHCHCLTRTHHTPPPHHHHTALVTRSHQLGSDGAVVRPRRRPKADDNRGSAVHDEGILTLREPRFQSRR